MATSAKRWLFVKEWLADVPSTVVKLLDTHDRWRRMAKILKLSQKACQRLEWIIYYHDHSATEVARHFGIHRKTFYHWYARFDETNLRGLEDHSKRPHQVRQKEFTNVQYERFLPLRRAHLRYGKMKLLELYQAAYPHDSTISSWKIQCMILKSGLYYHPQKQARINRKRQLSVKRKKITELKKKPVTGFLLCLDTVVRYMGNRKRYIITAIDQYAKVAFARMYTTHSSYNARDFLHRLHYLLDGHIENIQTDNGSEFKKYFDEACGKLDLPHYYSRVKTPKDNAVNERFNRTLEEEFIQMGHLTADVAVFNQQLTEWLVEYNFHRPHQTLGYESPMGFHFKYHKVLPMSSSSTNI